MDVKKICFSALLILFLILSTSSIYASDFNNSTEPIQEFKDGSMRDYYDDFGERGEWVLDENGSIVIVPSTKNNTYENSTDSLNRENTTDLRNNSDNTKQSYPEISSPANMVSLWREYVKNPKDFIEKYYSQPNVTSIDINSNPCNNPYSKEFQDFLNFVKENKDKPNAIESKDINVFYSKNSMYIVRILNPVNDPVGKGVSVTFTLNGKNINVKTDDKGYASFKFNCQSGKHTVEIHTGKISSKNYITVKPLFKTKITGKKFTVQLIKQKGKSVSKKTIKITFKGKNYKVTSNSKGIAVFKIPKNVKIGKYTIKTTYNGCIMKNKITVKR